MNKKFTIKVGVLVVNNNRLLLIKERNSHTGEFCWNIVKGSPDFQDASIRDTARREAVEEAGLRIKDIQFFSALELRRGERTIIQINFIAKSIREKPKISDSLEQKERGEEIVEARFFSRKELSSLKKEDFYGKRALQITREWASLNKKGKDYFLSLKD